MSESEKIRQFPAKEWQGESEEAVKNRLQPSSSKNAAFSGSVEVGSKAEIDKEVIKRQVQEIESAIKLASDQMEQAKEDAKTRTIMLISEGMQAIDQAQDAKLKGIIDGVYDLHEIVRKEHNKLAEAHNKSADALVRAWTDLRNAGAEQEALVNEGLEALRRQVKELQAQLDEKDTLAAMAQTALEQSGLKEEVAELKSRLEEKDNPPLLERVASNTGWHHEVWSRLFLALYIAKQALRHPLQDAQIATYVRTEERDGRARKQWRFEIRMPAHG